MLLSGFQCIQRLYIITSYGDRIQITHTNTQYMQQVRDTTLPMQLFDIFISYYRWAFTRHVSVGRYCRSTSFESFRIDLDIYFFTIYVYTCTIGFRFEYLKQRLSFKWMTHEFYFILPISTSCLLSPQRVSVHKKSIYAIVRLATFIRTLLGKNHNIYNIYRHIFMIKQKQNHCLLYIDPKTTCNLFWWQMRSIFFPIVAVLGIIGTYF